MNTNNHTHPRPRAVLFLSFAVAVVGLAAIILSGRSADLFREGLLAGIGAFDAVVMGVVLVGLPLSVAMAVIGAYRVPDLNRLVRFALCLAAALFGYAGLSVLISYLVGLVFLPGPDLLTTLALAPLELVLRSPVSLLIPAAIGAFVFLHPVKTEGAKFLGAYSTGLALALAAGLFWPVSDAAYDPIVDLAKLGVDVTAIETPDQLAEIVALFQQANGIEATGALDAATITALKASEPKSEWIVGPGEDADVATIGEALNRCWSDCRIVLQPGDYLFAEDEVIAGGIVTAFGDYGHPLSPNLGQISFTFTGAGEKDDVRLFGPETGSAFVLGAGDAISNLVVVQSAPAPALQLAPLSRIEGCTIIHTGTDDDAVAVLAWAEAAPEGEVDAPDTVTITSCELSAVGGAAVQVSGKAQLTIEESLAISEANSALWVSEQSNVSSRKSQFFSDEGNAIWVSNTGDATIEGGELYSRDLTTIGGTDEGQIAVSEARFSAGAGCAAFDKSVSAILLGNDMLNCSPGFYSLELDGRSRARFVSNTIDGPIEQEVYRGEQATLVLD